MPIRIAAIEVSHWHSVFDPAYLRQLARMPDVRIVAVQDPRPGIAAKRVAEIGEPAIYSDYRQMLEETKPDFVLALGRHSVMAQIAHFLLDEGFPFIMEKPMGMNADEVRAIMEKAEAKRAFAALPMPQRYGSFCLQARAMLANGSFGPLSHVYMRINGFSSARYPAWDCPWMLDPAIAGGGCLRNLATHGLDLFFHLTGEDAEVVAAQTSRRARAQKVEDYASVLVRSRSGVLGTLEVGNTYPRRTTQGESQVRARDGRLDGADGEWKISGRDAMVLARDGVVRVVTADAEQVVTAAQSEEPAYQALDDALRHWQRGEPPPVSVRDCHRAAVLIDRAYRLAGEPVAPA